jgi:hypothetical protein
VGCSGHGVEANPALTSHERDCFDILRPLALFGLDLVEVLRFGGHVKDTHAAFRAAERYGACIRVDFGDGHDRFGLAHGNGAALERLGMGGLGSAERADDCKGGKGFSS